MWIVLKVDARVLGKRKLDYSGCLNQEDKDKVVAAMTKELKYAFRVKLRNCDSWEIYLSEHSSMIKGPREKERYTEEMQAALDEAEQIIHGNYKL